MAESGTYDQSTIARRQKIAEAMLGDAMKPQKIEHWAQGLAQLGRAGIGGYMSHQANEEAKAEEYKQTADLYKAAGLPPPQTPEASPSIFSRVASAMSGGGQPAPETSVAAPAGPPPSDQASYPPPPAAGPAPTTFRPGIVAPPSGGAIAPQAPVAAAMGAPGDAGAAIAGIESGGKYDKLGPVTKTGDRAYGKYQVMGANIPQWTKTHLGQEMTPDQFLASPEAQDAVFKGQFGQYAQKYGPEGAAKAWFAGERGMSNPNARDQLGTTVSAYADKFNRAYQPAQPPYQVAGPPTAAPQSPVAQAMTPPAMPAPSGIFANVPKEQLPSILSGLTSKNPTLKALAVQQMGNYTKLQDYDIHHRPDGTIVAVNKKNPSEVRTIAGDSKGMVDFEASKAGAVEKAKALATREVAKPEQDKQNQKVADIVTQDIDRAIKTIDSATLPTTGATGNLISSVGGTAAHDLSKLLDTVKSNAGFQELSKMRQASPTGAALGSVTERELALLQSTIGNLEQSQSEAQLKDNLRRVKNTYMDIIHGEGKGPEREKLKFQEKAAPKGVDPGALEEARRRGLIK